MTVQMSDAAFTRVSRRDKRRGPHASSAGCDGKRNSTSRIIQAAREMYVPTVEARCSDEAKEYLTERYGYKDLLPKPGAALTKV